MPKTFFAKISNVLFAAVFATGLFLPVSPPAVPASLQPGPNFTVNDTSDPGLSTCATDHCSLRAAITAANAASMVSHTINFSLIYPTTLSLFSLLPDITGTMIITGPGSANLALSGNGAYKIFKLDSGASLDLSGVTIRNAYDGIAGGGGIYNDHGTLTVTDSVFANNLAGGGNGGAINNAGGTVTLLRTTFDHNTGFHDGAIASVGTLSITDSLFNTNDGRIGGAIEASGTLTINKSTFIGNVAMFDGGAIENAATLVVTNSTFVNNGSTQGADIDSRGGSVNVTNSTFSGAQLPSGNSIFIGGGANVIRNTIMDAGSGIPNCQVAGGTLTMDAFNLATDATCASATVKTEVQLNLGPLAMNGGSTPTQALLPGSVAIDAGHDTVCTAAVGAPNYGAGSLDQRGVARPQLSHCDVGAFEFQPTLVFSGFPSSGALHLDWSVNATLPPATTWNITYSPNNGAPPSPVTGLAAATRTLDLTGLTNYTTYTITLTAVNAGSPLTATIQMMPTDHFSYLPVIAH